MVATRQSARRDSDPEETTMSRKVTPFLWFNDQAEEAANYYVSVFKDAEILSVARFGDSSQGAAGSVMTVSYRLGNQEFTAINGGPHFSFTEAVSFMVECKDQEEVDYFWDRLSEGGETSMCGWLKDRYGLSWQVVPTALYELTQGTDPARASRVMQVMLTMTKLDIAKLREAYELG
jgi:predicted 3-demethylubiquinone-9 3-methyltransferase (glyoxalase superfamily)